MSDENIVNNHVPSTGAGDENFVIPEGAVDITDDKSGGVYKIIKKQGLTGALPQSGDTVYVHYVGTLTDGTKFDSSRDRGEQFQFPLGRSQVIKGWDLAVATMKKGEISEIIVSPQYGYGEGGSPPRIPPNATLIFEIELLTWEGEDISPDHDKSITRSIQKAGEKYDMPNDDAKVDVRIKGVHEGRVFIDEDLQFILGEGSEHGLPEGVDKALKKFRKGELSLIHIKPRWGYGKNGNAKYNVPPNAEVEFEMEMKDFENAKNAWQMTEDEKLEEAEKLKQRGTQFFQQGKNKLAASKYKRIVEMLEHETRYEGENKTKRDTLYGAAHNNLAMVFLKAGETVEAVKHCDKVLDEDPENVKALFRRGQAYQNQNDFEDAIKSYEIVIRLEPDNKAAQANIASCRKRIVEEHQHQKAVFANMFERLAKNEPVAPEETKVEKKPQENQPPATEVS